MGAVLRRAGEIEYWYEPKAVKNMNLRVRPDGQVYLSAPRRAPVSRADAFVAAKAGWISAARARLALARQQPSPPLPEKAEALALFTQVSEGIYPLFAQTLQYQRPVLRVRDMKTRWGVCAPAKRQITLNLRLAAKPLPLVEYVVLHEYCHFVHPDHQAGFWALMERLMPDCKARRRALRD